MVGEWVVEALGRPFFIAGYELYVAASVGIVLARGREETPESLLGDADTAMYQAKEAGRGGYEVLNEHRREDPERLALQEAMRDAISHEGLDVAYQPVIDLRARRTAASSRSRAGSTPRAER